MIYNRLYCIVIFNKFMFTTIDKPTAYTYQKIPKLFNTNILKLKLIIKNATYLKSLF